MVAFLSAFASFGHDISSDVLNDDSPPSVLLGISEPTGKNGWYNQPVSVIVRAFDNGSGVAHRQVSIGGAVWYKNSLTVKKDGIYWIYGKAIDKAGNVSTTSVQIKLDMTAPEIEFLFPDPKGYQEWYLEEVNLKLSGSDELSGVAATFLKVEGDSVATEISPWDAQEAFDEENVRDYQQIILGENQRVSETRLLIDESGRYTIQGYVEDMAGNRTGIEKKMKVDLVAPNIQINSPRKFYGNIQVEGSVADYDSGVHKIFVDTGSGWREVQVPENGNWQFEWNTDGLKDGEYLIKTKVIDSAGNRTYSSYTANVFNHFWPVFTVISVLISLGFLALFDPRRHAWLEFSRSMAKFAHMEKNAMKLRKELR